MAFTIRRGELDDAAAIALVHVQSEGFESVFLWVLEQNPAIGFYKKLGGEQLAQKLIEIGGVELQEIALGWRNIEQLLST